MVHTIQLKKIAFTLSLMFATGVVNAAGLGNLTLTSALGEPLSAEIELLSVKPEDLASLRAEIASQAAYSEQSLDRPASHQSIKLDVAKNSRGEPVLKLNSTQPMSDAFLDMLIQLEWPTGRLVKEYTVLLDPPGYKSKPTSSASSVQLPASQYNPESKKPAAPITVSPPAQVEDKSFEPAPIQKTAPSKSYKMIVADAKKSPKSKEDNPKATEPKEIEPKASKSVATKSPAPKLKSDDNREIHTTAQGDTLYSIARNNKPDGVSLEQMLIGLYQANPDAFDGKDINHLKVGQVIRVPSDDAMKAISPSQAKSQIKVHSAHWNTYKNKLAGIVSKSKSTSHASNAQATAGKVVAAEDKSVPPSTGIKDVVKLSASDAKNTSNAQEKINALQEEVTAKDNAVKDALSKTAALEKQIADMQKLLQVKNDAMVKLQQNADAAKATMNKISPDPAAANPVKAPEIKVPETKTSDIKPEEVKPEAKTITEEKSNTPDKTSAEIPVANPLEKPLEPVAAKPVESVKPVEIAPVVEPVAQPSFLGAMASKVSDVFKRIPLSPPLLAGLAGLPLLAAGWYALRNRRKTNLASFEDGIMVAPDSRANTVFGNTTSGTVDAGETSFLTDFSQSAVGGMIDAHDVDPIAEAEVYMAYGRDEQAEEILKDAIAKEPKRYELHLKLLEIYQGNNNVSAFESIAGEMYSTLGANNPNWAKVAALGQQIDPNNPLYKNVQTGSSSALETAPSNPDMVSSVASSDFMGQHLSNNDLSFDTGEKFAQTTTDFDLDSDLGAITLGGDNVVDVVSPQVDSAELSFSNSISNFSLDADVSEAEQVTSSIALDSRFTDTVGGGLTPKPVDLPTLDFDVYDAKKSPSIEIPSLATPSVDVKTESHKSALDVLPEINLDLASDSGPAVAAFKTTSSATSFTGKDFPDISDFDLSEISLDLDGNQASSTPVADQVVDMAESEEVETKLDLIKAYIDMEDTVGAKELIEEVMKEGGQSQRQRASELLAQLG